MTKADLASPDQILAQLSATAELEVESWFPVSGTTGEGVDALVEHLDARMPEGPQLYPDDMLTDVPHSRLGSVKTLGTPVKFSATPTELRRGAPLLGEHTAEVLHEVGYSDDDIAALVENGTVVVAAG